MDTVDVGIILTAGLTVVGGIVFALADIAYQLTKIRESLEKKQ